MIYEWIRTLFHMCKSIRHFFRKFFCKDYYTEKHGYKKRGLCGKYSTVPHKSRFCKYYWCPKRSTVRDAVKMEIE